MTPHAPDAAWVGERPDSSAPAVDGAERDPWLVAWVSALPLALDSLWPGPSPLRGLSLLALVSMVWLALAGLPRPPSASPWRSAAHLVSLALPPLGLALGLDAARLGVAPLELLLAPAAALGLCLLWGHGAALAHGPWARRVQGLGWCLAVPGLAALELALGWATRAGEAARDPWPVLSPLSWCADWLVEGPAGLELRGTLTALATGAGFVFAVRLARTVDRSRAWSDPQAGIDDG